MSGQTSPPESSESVGDLRAALRGTGLVLSIRVAAAAIAYVSIVLLARWMGAVELGIYTYAFAWLALASIPAGLGLPTVCVRFLPAYFQASDWPRLKGLLLFAFGATLAIGLGLGVSAAIGVRALGTALRPDYVTPLSIALGGLAEMTTLVLASQVGRASGWLALAYAPSQIVYPVLLLAAVAWLSRSGGGPTAARVVPISLGIAALVVGAQITLYARRLAGRLRGTAATFESALWMRTAFSIVLFEGFFALLGQTDIVLVGVFLSPQDVAYYGAAVRTAILVRFVTDGVGTLIGPGIAQLASRHRSGEMQRLLRGTLPWSLLSATAVFLVLAAAGRHVLALFGQEFTVAWPAMLLLAGANLIRTAIGPGALVLNMTGHQTDCAWAYFAAALVNVAGNLLLIPRFGLPGAAFSTAVTMIGADLFLRLRVGRRLGLDPSVTCLLRRAARP